MPHSVTLSRSEAPLHRPSVSFFAALSMTGLSISRAIAI